MKKVLYTATVLSHICQFHLPYLKAFQEQDYEIHVAARNNLGEKNGLKLKYVDKHVEIPFMRSPLNMKNLKAYKMLKRQINSENYDLIVCNTPVGGILTRLAGKKARKKGTKIVYMVHGFHFYKGASKKNWIIYYPIEKFFAKRCDAIITINKEDYERASNKFKTKVYHIHGVGVNPERYHPISLEEREKKRAELGYSKDAFIGLVVGELLPNKNQIQVVKAFEKVKETHSNVKLLVAGNGSNREELERYVKEKSLEDVVEFLGYCTHLEDYQRIVDIGVSCSIREGLGLNVIESMMSGNTFIATKNRGHNELIKDGVNGFLVDVSDADTLKDRINALIEDKELKEKLEKNATEQIKDYSLTKTLDEMRNIFSEIL